jgi:hypothetical protein
VNTIINFWLQQVLGNVSVAAQVAASQEGLSSMEVVCYDSKYFRLKCCQTQHTPTLQIVTAEDKNEKSYVNVV